LQAFATLLIIAVFAVMLPTAQDYDLLGLSGVNASIRGGLQASFSQSVSAHPPTHSTHPTPPHSPPPPRA
jgi:hypothetical protein